jgi:hypothetical protein
MLRCCPGLSAEPDPAAFVVLLEPLLEYEEVFVAAAAARRCCCDSCWTSARRLLFAGGEMSDIAIANLLEICRIPRRIARAIKQSLNEVRHCCKGVKQHHSKMIS